MWYKIDFARLVLILLPPVLRSKLLVAMLHALTLPLRSVYEEFRSLKARVDNRLNITGRVIYLEKVLNDAFFLVNRQIYIEDQDKAPEPVFYLKSEIQEPPVLYTAGEGTRYTLTHKGGSIVKVNIVIKVPTFLCTSLVSQNEDKYGWVHLRAIKNLLNIYKPAGRTYSIELYDYE